MEYKIEKGIPIPDKLSYPFPNMEVGDCFSVPLDNRGNVYMASLLFIARHQPTWKFKIAKSGKVARCWRVK